MENHITVADAPIVHAPPADLTAHDRIDAAFQRLNRSAMRRDRIKSMTAVAIIAGLSITVAACCAGILGLLVRLIMAFSR